MKKIDRILEFLVVAYEYDDPESIRMAFEKVADDYGFSHYGLFAYDASKQESDKRYRVIVSDFPSEFEARNKEIYIRVITGAWPSMTISRSAFFWDQTFDFVEKDKELRKAIARLSSEIHRFGFPHGMTLPVFDRRGLIGDLKLAGRLKIEITPLEITLLSALADTFLSRMLELPPQRPAPAGLPAHLPSISAREQTIIQALADGMTSIETAKTLGLSNHTVDWYVTGLQSKFKARNRQNLIAIAMRLGLIS